MVPHLHNVRSPCPSSLSSVALRHVEMTAVNFNSTPASYWPLWFDPHQFWSTALLYFPAEDFQVALTSSYIGFVAIFWCLNAIETIYHERRNSSTSFPVSWNMFPETGFLLLIRGISTPHWFRPKVNIVFVLLLLYKFTKINRTASPLSYLPTYFPLIYLFARHFSWSLNLWSYMLVFCLVSVCHL